MKSLNRILTLVLSLILIAAPVGQANAAIIDNSQVIDQVQQTIEKDDLLQAINRVDVQQQLLSMGVTAADLENRLNQQIDELPAGGDVVGIIVLIFIVFIITDVIGATDIFPFIHPVK